MGRGSEQSGDAATALLYGKVSPRRRPSLDRELAATLIRVLRLFEVDPGKYQHAEDRELGKGAEACVITAFAFARAYLPSNDIKGRKRLARETAERCEELATNGILERVEQGAMSQAHGYRLTAAGPDYGRRLRGAD